MDRFQWLHCMQHEAHQIHAPWCPALSWEKPGACVCEPKENPHAEA